MSGTIKCVNHSQPPQSQTVNTENLDDSIDLLVSEIAKFRFAVLLSAGAVIVNLAVTVALKLL